MKIKLSNAGKRFNREWIFRRAGLEFVSGNAYAITGPNGSGKSTLLQSIGGMLQLSEGTIELADERWQMTEENIYQQTSFCAPYLDVIEEMTLTEFLQFHNQFKPFIEDFTTKKIVEVLGLEKAVHKQIR
jgi:ABC-type multidrug transport system ATPase subunit